MHRSHVRSGKSRDGGRPRRALLVRLLPRDARIGVPDLSTRTTVRPDRSEPCQLPVTPGRPPMSLMRVIGISRPVGSGGARIRDRSPRRWDEPLPGVGGPDRPDRSPSPPGSQLLAGSTRGWKMAASSQVSEPGGVPTPFHRPHPEPQVNVAVPHSRRALAPTGAAPGSV